MAHFAKIDDNNKVIRVIVVSEEYVNSGRLGDLSNWIQTSYNTHGGKHLTGGNPLRKNFAGVGYTYDKTRDAFIPPHYHPSWVLNEETCLWECPVPHPNKGVTDISEYDGKDYIWDEENVNWKEI